MASLLDTPRTSPTKRGHDSPSSTSSSPSQPASALDLDPPPLSKTSKKKLTYDHAGDQSQPQQQQQTQWLVNASTPDLLVQASEVGESWAPMLPHAPPSPSQADDEQTGQIGAESEQGQSIPQSVGQHTGVREHESQVRKLMEMPLDLANKLSRLSSQHQQSEYNNLKRSMAAAAAAEAALQAPLIPLQQVPPFPHPLPRPIMTRSQSGPPASTSTSSPTFTTAVPTFVRRPIPTTAMRTNAPATFGTLFRVETPPRSYASPPQHESTGLTPTLLNFTVGEPTTYNGAPTNISATLVEASQPNLSTKRTLIPIDGRSTSPRSPSTSLTPIAGTQTPPEVVRGTQWAGLLPGMQFINGVPVKTSLSHPMNISAIIPDHCIAPLSLRLFNVAGLTKSKSPLTTSFAIASNQTVPNSTKTQTPFLIDSWPHPDLWDLTRGPSTASEEAFAAAARGGPNTLGNFFLSSCPGKKVRLNVVASKGNRGAVCRDVKTDLARAQEVGVKLIVCCLDDQELEFLGAPWEEYASAASQLELGIIRIPMPEGFAPSSPKYLDEQLTRIITNHTLRGESVLAHCRGGIGRAGVLACCWMIKMGFVRGENRRGLVDPMLVVEKVIEVIRRRRSVKSIETPQQAAFLLEFVQYLQQQGRLVKAHEV